MRRCIRPRRAGENGAGPADRAAGFTLVELLVVIGIIAVLISILLPILVKAKLRAQQVVCASNMRQIALACLTYARDNKDWLPVPSDWTENLSVNPFPPPSYAAVWLADWVELDFENGALWPYIGGGARSRYGVFNCPGDPDPRPQPRPGGGTAYRNFSYCFNVWLEFEQPWPNYKQSGHFGVQLNKIHHPDHKILLAEPVSTGGTTTDFDLPSGRVGHLGNVSYAILKPALTSRHFGTANEAFCDGHVEPLDPSVFIMDKVIGGIYYPIDSRQYEHYVIFYLDY